jgi:hypothetical protein
MPRGQVDGDALPGVAGEQTSRLRALKDRATL